MQTVRFQGLDELIATLDASVAVGDPEEITQGVKSGLERLIRENSLQLPEEAQRPGATSYGRHLLYRSESLGYVVVAMAWGPGQATPLHDHAGIWCVEGVWKGELEVVRYQLLGREGERFRFARQESTQAGIGSAGSLIPPFEYHTIANSCPQDTSVTLHIYGGEMTSCCVFEPIEEDWYQKQTKPLSYDN